VSSRFAAVLSPEGDRLALGSQVERLGPGFLINPWGGGLGGLPAADLLRLPAPLVVKEYPPFARLAIPYIDAHISQERNALAYFMLIFHQATYGSSK